MKSRVGAEIQIILAAMLFSTGGAAIKAAHFTNWQVAAFRSAVAGAALLVFLPAARRGYSLRGVLVALAFSATMILFVTANKLTTSMNTIFLQDTAPLYVLALSPVLLKERIRRSDLGFMAVIAVGLALFFVGVEPPQTTATNPFLGNILAVASGLTWALTIMGLRWLGKDGRPVESLPAVVMGNVMAALFCLPMALPVGAVRPVDWLIIVYLGVFQIGLAYVLMSRGLAGAPAFTACILLLAEPVFNPVWSFLAHGERPGRWAVAGGVLILGATVAKAWSGTRQPDKVQP
ncbi:MAG TPA: EamA family transporter [Phycisphaerae bacterium]|jgi:drug/metabolite transporter (DMT)-like permease|nr:EamA family transporter [Phycisphaerae bacterium]HOB74946.1 EamA family transporter [Phycisphaerae bacterium]HOJ56090.1 EamA family transporter [Phycisphaerae bacterium]HOL25777.1 EamA family transporter [Phycisphaerae bacterium]HPP19530.1 EamA family transporter [Phycisphaerae bacterium]